MSGQLHDLLRQQLQGASLDPAATPCSDDDWRTLLERVSTVYSQSDRERIRRERAISSSSAEVRELHRRLAHSRAEQASLRRVATAVAAAADTQQVFDLVAEEVAKLYTAEAARVVRYEDGNGRIVGSFGAVREYDTHFATGEQVTLDCGSASSQVYRTGAPGRVYYAAAELADPVAARCRRIGFSVGVAAPIIVAGDLWGSITVMRVEGQDLPDDAESSLAEYAELVSLAIANTEQLATLRERATCDALTGLLNHGVFLDRLEEETQRARRHERPFSVVVIDLDRFKEINDALGHQVGDRVLAEFATFLAGSTRCEDVIARTGGEEFGWLLPETAASDALSLVDRVRRRAAATSFGGFDELTFSAGVCEVSQVSGRAADLYTAADMALYEAKRLGRNAVVGYRPDLARLRQAEHGPRWRERERTLSAVHALARAVDARDPAMRAHSERVADLACLLARELGWDELRVGLLREAAVVHDVGKIGIGDSILQKPAQLTGEEYEQMKAHVVLGSTILEEVLTREQTAWVRQHHERWDGSGYPDGLPGEELSHGARILSVADAWDVMTTDRPYQVGRRASDALLECQRCSGSQFAPEVVEALVRLWERGALPRVAAGAEPPRHPATLAA